MPRRNHNPPRRRRLLFLPPEPPPPTPRQLARRLVELGLAHPVILEASEVHTPPRQRDEENR